LVEQIEERARPIKLTRVDRDLRRNADRIVSARRPRSRNSLFSPAARNRPLSVNPV